jgi:ribonuclease P protein component
MNATKKESKKLERLLKRSDFLLANAKGRKWVSKGVIVLATPNAVAKIRVGITVTKKLEKTAVGRNRMKRRLRAASASVLPDAGKAGMDYVLIARAETATRLYTDLQKDLRWCLEKLGQADAG